MREGTTVGRETVHTETKRAAVLDIASRLPVFIFTYLFLIPFLAPRAAFYV